MLPLIEVKRNTVHIFLPAAQVVDHSGFTSSVSECYLISDLVDQVSLLFFIGQNGLHELDADYIAVSYVKGHILLTWDLGSGPRCGH